MQFFIDNLLIFFSRPEVLAILAVAITWFLNELSKRRHEDYIRREKRYVAIISNIRGFYVGSDSKSQKMKFLDLINECWLYCPDNVIQRGYDFLKTVHDSQRSSDEKKEKALGAFILEIRKDLISKKFGILKRTELKPEDFKHFSAN